MLSEQDKYQNILSQIHELNRQNLLAEYERNENIIDKLSELEHQIQIKSNESNPNELVKKLLYSIVFLIIINLILTFFLLFFFYDVNLTKTEPTITSERQQVLDVDKESKKTEGIDINVNIFDEKKSEIEENYTEIKPIIKVDTQYTCEDDNYSKKYKIPYTIEIKGKLYSDKFIFVLQNSSERKKCRISKEDI